MDGLNCIILLFPNKFFYVHSFTTKWSIVLRKCHMRFNSIKINSFVRLHVVGQETRTALLQASCKVRQLTSHMSILKINLYAIDGRYHSSQLRSHLVYKCHRYREEPKKKKKHKLITICRFELTSVTDPLITALGHLFKSYTTAAIMI